MKKRLTNLHNSSIKLFVRNKGVEYQTEVHPGKPIIVDDYETKTIRIYKKKKLISFEPELDSDDKIKNSVDNQKEEEKNNKTEFLETSESKTENNNPAQITPPEDSKEIKYTLEVAENEVEQYIEEGYVKGEWTEEEEKFLRKNYPTKGRKYCSTNLNRKESSVQKKINALGLKKRKKRKK